MLTLLLPQWLSIAVLSAGVLMVASKPPPKTTKPRAGSVSRAGEDGTTPRASTSENPFDDPVVLGAAVDAATDDSQLPRGKRQGLLGKLFGGAPEDVAAETALVNAEAGVRQKNLQKQPGFQQLEDDDASSIAPSTVTDYTRGLDERQRAGPEELEMATLDKIDALEYDRASVEGDSRWGETVDDFGEFEEGKKGRD